MGIGNFLNQLSTQLTTYQVWFLLTIGFLITLARGVQEQVLERIP